MNLILSCFQICAVFGSYTTAEFQYQINQDRSALLVELGLKLRAKGCKAFPRPILAAVLIEAIQGIREGDYCCPDKNCIAIESFKDLSYKVKLPMTSANVCSTVSRATSWGSLCRLIRQLSSDERESPPFYDDLIEICENPKDLDTDDANIVLGKWKSIRTVTGMHLQRMIRIAYKSIDLHGGEVEYMGVLRRQKYQKLLSLAQDSFEEVGNRRFLGEGGFGKVYRSTLKDGFNIAIKEIGVSSNKLRHVFREIEGLKAVRGYKFSPYFVQLKGIQMKKWDGIEIAMEYLDGMNGHRFFNALEEIRTSWITSEGIQMLARMVKHLLEGLHMLHGKYLLHGDFKLENIVVSNDGSVKIVDLGLITDMSSEKYGLGGTPGYAPPESQFEYDSYTEGADFWPLGVIVLEAITGNILPNDLEKICHSLECYQDAAGNLVGDARKIADGIARPMTKSMLELAIDFAEKILQANPEERPSFGDLINHGFIQYQKIWIKTKIEEYQNMSAKSKPKV